MLGPRLLAATGAIYVIFALVGNGIAVPPEAPEPDAPLADIGAFAIAHPPTTQTLVGLGLEAVALLAFIAFLAYAFAATRAAAPVASALVVAAGGVTSAVKIGSMASYLVVMTRAAELGPELAGAFTALNDTAFLITWATGGLFTVALASASKDAGLVPTWLATTGLVLGAAMTLALLAVETPFAFVPYVLGLFWLLVTSGFMVKRAATA